MTVGTPHGCHGSHAGISEISSVCQIEAPGEGQRGVPLDGANPLAGDSD